MRLAKLTLAGFKSFADKTEIPFDQPIVGIVGPNGCGKSNVVDAIKWVLGDQSPKSLRGGAMMDVIFNGSAKRKPAGMASVTLTFDNPVVQEAACGLASDDETRPAPQPTRRALALDTDQVAVTRQLYRDGTSEYLVNNQRARLRDIKELFMDTGIGTDAYSIIEQGKVARMLEANAAERRQIFEEAAGVSRFKARKKEALRKLDRTEQNLALVRQRLEDTEKRLRSVKMQAARARSFQEHSAKLRELQLTFSLAEYHRLQKQLEELQDHLEQAEADRLAAQRELAKHETALDDAETQRRAVAQRSSQLHQARVEQQSAKDKAHQQAAFARQTLTDVQTQIQRDQARLTELADRQTQLTQEADEHTEEVTELTTAQARAKDRLDAAQTQQRELQHTLNEKRARLEDEKNGLTDLLRRVSKLHNEITSLDAFERSLVGTREKLDERTGHIAAQLEAMLTQRDQADAQLAESLHLIDAEQARLQEQKDLAGRFGAQQKDLAARLAESREKRADLDSRRRLLQEMEDNLEGIADPVKAVLSQAACGLAPGDRHAADPRFDIVRGLVAELIDCDVEHAPLVEAALGEHQQALVVDRLADLCDPASPLTSPDALAGRVGFLAIDQPPLPPLHTEAHGLSAAGPALRPVIDLVRYPAWLGPVAWRLLGRTLVVRDLDTAMMLRATLPGSPSGGGYRFVTRAGEVLDEQCRVLAGPLSANASGGLISRRSELAALQVELHQLDAIIASDHQALTALSDQAAHLERVTAELQQSIFDASAIKVELRSRLDSLRGQIATLEKERPVLAAEAEAIHRQLRDADEKRTTHRSEASDLEAQSVEREARRARLDAEITAAADTADAAREQVTSLRVDAGKLAEQLSASERQSRQFEIARADVTRQHTRLAEELKSTHTRIAELQATQTQAEQDAQSADRALQELITQCELIQRKVTAADEELASLKDRFAQRRSAVDTLDGAVHQAQMKQRELEVKLDSVTQRTADQLDLDLPEAYRKQKQLALFPSEQQHLVQNDADPGEADEAPPSDPSAPGHAPEPITQAATEIGRIGGADGADPFNLSPEDWDRVKAEIDELRGKIARLGTVNVDAIAEEDQLAGKQDELADQVKDIEDAEKQLHALIEQLNHDSRTRFEDTFNQVRENFAGPDGMFRKLFGGGRADVFLEPDEDGKTDILESGIAITAKPPGKEPRALSQLSGGEKTMTAVALLMAIFKSRPSPYAILDEVDAALDEANVERFINVINGFLDKSHFIVITHHKRTMQGCNQLYGITMQERGVSKRVSVNFDQISHNGEIHRDALDATGGPAPAPDSAAAPDSPPRAAPASPPSSRQQLAEMLQAREPVEVEN
ncbi:MAG: chromosome segregation protein SMC [Planctomycetota bacterium]